MLHNTEMIKQHGEIQKLNKQEIVKTLIVMKRLDGKLKEKEYSSKT